MTPEERHAYYLSNKEMWPKWKSLSKEKQQHILEYQKEYRKNNRFKVSQTQKNLRKKKQEILINLLGGKCVDCNSCFPPEVYDFHHLNPEEKDFTIGEYMGYSLQKLKQEAQKCVLLCANCHRIKHAV